MCIVCVFMQCGIDPRGIKRNGIGSFRRRGEEKTKGEWSKGGGIWRKILRGDVDQLEREEKRREEKRREERKKGTEKRRNRSKTRAVAMALSFVHPSNET